MQVSIRSSRLAPLAKCPKDIVRLTSEVWARPEWEQQICFSSTTAFRSALHPCKDFLKEKTTVTCKNREHRHFSEKFHKSLSAAGWKRRDLTTRLPGIGLFKIFPSHLQNASNKVSIPFHKYRTLIILYVPRTACGSYNTQSSS